MRSSRRRVVATLRGRYGAAARPAPGVARADWRAVVARGAGVAPDPAAPVPPPVPAPPAPPVTPAVPAVAVAKPVPAVPALPVSPVALAARPVAPAVIALTLGVALLGQAVALLVVRPGPAMASADAPVRVGPVAPFARTRPPARRAAVPVRVAIPRIGVSSTLLPLGLLPDGTLDTPSDFDRAGWYTRGARPGERGPAVVVGHVDSRTGPAVFFRLRELRRGDVINVRRADRTLVRYVVRTVRSVPKSEFPTKAVYGATRRSTLRLVTCGGAFDARARSYRDNVVVFADLAPRRAK